VVDSATRRPIASIAEHLQRAGFVMMKRSADRRFGGL
jgi:hypothetical protein